ncbi:hypothetical protein AAL_03042 [Moelleriella libera RCEF 2490]|uniref:Complex 1 LYR protein n=1 Tax=Moelleriella libera RCEF 2490 TaxID=1081109 RepID=A0A168E867_9HYPO|nr:hypothetical protein AAL_03042 [Moelleriella libera RCEF 2490]
MGDAVHVYRRLYRALLKAVQYASPARFTVRDQLRVAFREPGASLDAEATKRTLWFLQAAAKERGLEHKILKNLVKVRQRREARATAWRQVLAKSSRKYVIVPPPLTLAPSLQ